MDVKPDALEQLKKYEDVVAACNRCGFCTSYCPTYNATGKETHSPRGRNQTFRALLEGRLPDSKEARESIDTCLLCGECTSVCFSEVPVADLMVQARNYLNATQGIPFGLKFFLNRVLPRPRLLHWVLKISFLGKKIGVSELLKAFNFLPRVAPALAAADALVEKVPFRFLLEEPDCRPFLEENILKKENTLIRAQQEAPPAASGKPAALPPRPTVAYFPVCGSRYLRTTIGLSTLALLKKLGVNATVPEMACCGLPAASYGVTDQVRALAEANIARLERGHYDALIVDDSSCAAHVKDYPHFFPGNSRGAARAHEITRRLRDVASFLLQRGLKDLLAKASWSGGPVAYHDPCKSQYAQKMTQPPRELLSAVRNLRLVPVADADQCCGGGGTYSFTQPEISQKVLAAKVKNIMASGCGTVVTSSASCLIQLAFGLRRAGSPIKALHLTEFLGRVLS